MDFDTINKLLDIFEKYDFEVLDEDFNDKGEREIKLEYTGDDIVYKEESEFENKFEFGKFCNEQGEITVKHFVKALEELKNKKLNINGYEWDDYDYPCVWIKV